MYCKNGKKSKPVNQKLYNRLKGKIKARSKVWPSAYASGQLVRAYKSKGGKYRCGFGSLDRWFKEKWVNVCKPKGKGYAVCGRSKSSKKGYPYCRPSKRINSQTPKTVGEIGKAKIKRMCSKKRQNPYQKVFLKFGEKTNVGEKYNQMEKQQTCGFGSKKEESSCGFGRRRQRFGNNIGPTSSNLDTFYQNGTADSSHLTTRSKNCLSGLYNQPPTALQRFGKKNFIQEANKQSIKKGTVGAFTRWCKSKGYPKVTTGCIKLGKKSPILRTRRRAIFAQNIRSKKRNYSFGRCRTVQWVNSKGEHKSRRICKIIKCKKNSNAPWCKSKKVNVKSKKVKSVSLKGVNSDINYLKR
jgi:hypothetical protein